MKKVISSIAFAMAACLCANAQVKQYTHDLTPFSAIDVANDFEVSVVTGETFSVVLSVDEPYRDYVNCVVSGNTLNISVDEKKVPADVKKLYKGKGVTPPTFRASVSLPGKLESVSLHDKAVFFEAKGMMANDNVSVTLTDNAQIKTMDIDANSVKVSLDKKSSANIVIYCDNLNISAAGSSNFNVEQNVKNSDIKLQGSCNISVNGSCSNLKLNTKGSAKATFVGTANDVDYVCAGSSSTNAMMLVSDNANISMTGSCSLSEAASKNVKLNLSNGATVTYAGQPSFEIDNIKSSSVIRGGK